MATNQVDRGRGARHRPRIAVVGVCAAGKSTLVDALKGRGYEARHVAQEHSYVPEMWRIIGRPDVLIYLDVPFEIILARRPKSGLRSADVDQQRHRLAHARQHCDLYMDTGSLTPNEVQRQVLTFLNRRRGGPKN